MSRFTRFAASVRFNVYGQAIQAVLPLLFVPFVIHRLGKEAYGLYGLIGVVTAQLNLLSFGAGPATVKYLAEYESSGDPKRIERLIGNSIVFYGLTGAMGALLLVWLAPFLGREVLRPSPQLAPAVGFILYCAAAGFFSQSLARTFHSVPQALHRFDWWNGLESACTLLQYGGAVALLLAGFWLRALAVWTLAIMAVNLLAYAALSRHLLPKISLKPSYDQEMMRHIIGFGGWLFLSQVAWSVFYQVDKLVLSHYVALAEMPYYLVSFALAQKLFVVVNPVMPVLLPFSSAMHGVDDREGARKLFLGGTKLTIVLMWPATVLAFFFAPAFLDLWLKGGFGLNAGWPLRFLLLGTFASALPAFGLSIAHGFGKVRPPAIAFTLAVAAGVALWPIAIPRYGAVGAAAVFLLLQTSYSSWLLAWCGASVVGVSTLQLASVLARPFLLSVPLALAAFGLRNSVHGWIGLGAVGACGMAGFFAASFFWALDAEEQGRVRSLWRR